MKKVLKGAHKGRNFNWKDSEQLTLSKILQARAEEKVYIYYIFYAPYAALKCKQFIFALKMLNN